MFNVIRAYINIQRLLSATSVNVLHREKYPIVVDSYAEAYIKQILPHKKAIL